MQPMMFTGPTAVEVTASSVIIVSQHLSSSLNRLLFMSVSKKLETALMMVSLGLTLKPHITIAMIWTTIPNQAKHG